MKNRSPELARTQAFILVDSLRAMCEPGLGYDFGYHIISTLIQSARTFAYDFRNEKEKTSAYWRDIGTIDAYYAASMDLVQETPQFDPYFNDSQPATPTRHPFPKHALRARVHSDAYVAQSVLSPSVHIAAGAEIDGAHSVAGCSGRQRRSNSACHRRGRRRITCRL